MIPNYDIKSQSESYGTYTPEVPTMSMMFPKRNQRRWKLHWSWRATFATVNLQEQVHLATELCGTWIARNSHGLSIDYHPDVISVSGGRLFKHSRYMIRRHGWWLLHVGGLLASIILEPPYDMSERYRYTTLSAVSSLFWTTAEHSAKIACDSAFANLPDFCTDNPECCTIYAELFHNFRILNPLSCTFTRW